MLQSFSYTYGDGGNKLTSVNGGDAYTYDANGNMSFDGRKGISVEYNELNLPAKISKGNESISYIYAADGRKLAMQFGSSLIYYRGGFIYNGNELDKILHEEGSVVKSSGGYSYYYALKDHLGSTRVLCKASGNSLIAEQNTEYYPFGLAFEYNSLDKNKYLFSGKEYQNELIGGTKLELYDFGSRFYDTEIGRWFAVDPALQLVSPYGYCRNNPMSFVDPNGEWIWPFIMAVLGNIALNTADKAINHDVPIKEAFMSSLQLPTTNIGIGDWKPSTPGMYAQKVANRMSEVSDILDKRISSEKIVYADYKKSRGIATLEGISLDLFHISGSVELFGDNGFMDSSLPFYGCTLSFLKDSREHIGITLTFNSRAKYAETTFVGVNSVKGYKHNGKPLNIEDTYGYGHTRSYGAIFGSHSTGGDGTFMGELEDRTYTIDTYGVSVGYIPGAWAIYDTYTVGFSIPSFPALIKKWIK